MTPELTALALAGLLQVVQFVLMAVPANLQLGPHKTGGPRDVPLEVTGTAGRLKRAMDNRFAPGSILVRGCCMFRPMWLPFPICVLPCGRLGSGQLLR